MNFNSIEFLLFYATVFVLYFTLAPRWRWGLLLIASYGFYGRWNAAYLLLILFATLCAYEAGRRLARTEVRHRRFVLVFAVVLLLLPWLFFKYGAFCANSFNALLTYCRIEGSVRVPDVLLPVGISFFTFQAVSYVIDVYRNPRAAESHLGLFALYIAFFPQLVAGPIERASNIVPQLHRVQTFCRSRATSGFRLIAWGLFKKMVIADRLATLIEPVFASPRSYDGVFFLGAAMAFGIQIYCDFSAYSDIAVGSARALGIGLMRNFNNPYLAVSVRDFWNRWHISLSTWFRDYVYLPLGGSRVAASRWACNVLIVFLISGLWHGAAWTFVFWGALHGLALVFERLAGKPLGLRGFFRFPLWIKRVVTFLLVSVLWIPFRAGSMSDALYMLSRLATGWRWRLAQAAGSGDWSILLPVETATALVLGGAIAVLIAVEWFAGPAAGKRLAALPRGIRWTCYWLLVEATLLFGVHDAGNPFIYFQF